MLERIDPLFYATERRYEKIKFLYFVLSKNAERLQALKQVLFRPSL